MQLYRDLSVVTARPSPEEEAQAPHRLYGVLTGVGPAAETCTAQRWRVMAIAEIAAAHAAGAVPILVGGTGLYLKALVEGLSEIPAIPAEVRAEAVARHTELGAEAFHAELARMDPATAARLPPSDTQRLTRAWEVCRATGRPFSDWIAAPRSGPPPGVAFRTYILMPDRAWLHQRIDARLWQMIEQGALEELAPLADLLPESPLGKAVGVPELLAYSQGRVDLPQAVALAQAATRQYAKRQCTFFRRQLPAARIGGAQEYSNFRDEIFSIICKNG